MHRMLEDPEVTGGCDLLSDHSAIDFTATTDLVKACIILLQQLESRIGPFRCAVVTSGDASFGMARMYQSLTESNVENVAVFRDLDEARAWLRSK